MRRAFVLVLGIAAFGVHASTGWAKAKSRDSFGRVENLEMVITEVDVSDAGGDADTNFKLRLVGPNETLAFPKIRKTFKDPDRADPLKVFWRPGWSAWLKHIQGVVFKEVAEAVATGWKWKRKGKMLRRVYYGPKKPSDFSDQCRACAGDGSEGTGCNPSADGYASHPCPKLFSCAACVYDLRRLPRFDGDLGLSDFMPKAELFVNNKGEKANDFNATLVHALRGVRILPRNVPFILEKTAAISDGFDLCTEFEWTDALDGKNSLDGKKKEWVSITDSRHSRHDPNSICGKHVLISGVAVEDDEHDDRLEVHPVNSLIVANHADGSNVRSYSLGAFIDGSNDDGNFWTFDYRKFFFTFNDHDGSFCSYMNNHGMTPCWWTSQSDKDEWWSLYQKTYKPMYRSEVLVALESLQDTAPDPKIVGDSTTGQGASQLWESDCRVELYKGGGELPLNASVVEEKANLKDAKARKLCEQKLRVNLATNDTGGAAYTADLFAGWKHSNLGFKIQSVNLDTPDGIIAENPPATVTQGKCSGPTATSTALRRWYRWTVTTSADYAAFKSLDWKWDWAPKTMQLVAAPTLAKGESKVTLWLPANGHPAPPVAYGGNFAVSVYAATAEDKSRVGTGKLAWASDEIAAPSPHVAIDAAPAKKIVVANKLTYQTTISASAKGLCGDASKWVYAWKRTRHGKTVGTVPQGTKGLTITLSEGDQESFEVTARDPWGVEVAHDALLIEAPSVTANLEAKCADGKWQEIPTGNPPWGWSDSSALVGPPSTSLCSEVRILATVGRSKGQGIKFPDVPVDDPKLTWNVEYATGPGAWKNWSNADVLRNKTQTKSVVANDLYVIVPTPIQTIAYRAELTFADKKYGGSVTTSVEDSNDGPVAAQLATYLGGLWKWARAGKPLPIADPCGLRCDGVGPIANDWLAQAISRSLWDLKVAQGNPKDSQGLNKITSRLRDVSSFAVRDVAKERGLSYNVAQSPTAAVFAKALHLGTVGESVQKRARANSLKVLLHDPAFFGKGGPSSKGAPKP